MNSSEQTSKASAQRTPLEQVVAGMMQTLPPALAKAVRKGAVPRWADRRLLQELAGPDIGLDVLIETLTRFQFAAEDSQGLFRYREEVREALLVGLRHEDPQAFQSAHQTALDFFTRLVDSALPADLPAMQREQLVHLLIVDEPSGLRLLNERLEEAGYYRQPGAVEMLVEIAAQLAPYLSASGRRWLQYFTACLDWFYQRNDWGAAVFRELFENETDRLLQALAGWKAGQVLAARQHWSEAVRLYHRSLKRLHPGDEDVYRARVMLSVGEAYCSMAEQNGGLSAGLGPMDGPVGKVLYFMQYLPLLLLEWLVRRVDFLPSLYVGSTYQDWIIAYLLHRAGRWFGWAERLFLRSQNPVELTEARLALARIEHQEGRWSRAKRRYRVLEQAPQISRSQYRTAKVRLGQGQAALGEGHLNQAAALLGEAAGIFRAFHDSASLGAAACLLGHTYARQGKPVEAAVSFLESIQELRAGDTLALTRSIWHLEQLNERFTLPEELKARIGLQLEQTPQRSTLGRFPERIQSTFQRLALFGALPLTYGLAVVLTLLGIYQWFVVAASILLLQDFLWIVVMVLLPFLVIVWGYRGIYALIGLLAVYVIGRRLDPIEREQPVSIALDAVGLKRAGNQPAVRLDWADITDCFSIDYKVRRNTVHLVSQTLVGSASHSIPVEGILSGYDFFKRDLYSAISRQPAAIKLRNRDFIFLDPWWTWGTVLAILAVITSFALMGEISINFSLQMEDWTVLKLIGTIVPFTLASLLLAFPAVPLWRLLAHRIRLRGELVRSELGPLPVVLPTWLVILAAVVFSATALLWLLVLYFL